MYKRWTDTLLDYIGDLGGMTMFILGLGFFLVLPIMRHQMSAELIEQTYQVQHYNKDDT